MTVSLFGCFDPKKVAMLAESFMVRLEAEARLVAEVLPSSTSRFLPFSPSSQFVFKETDLKGEQVPGESGPSEWSGNRRSEGWNW